MYQHIYSWLVPGTKTSTCNTRTLSRNEAMPITRPIPTCPIPLHSSSFRFIPAEALFHLHTRQTTGRQEERGDGLAKSEKEQRRRKRGVILFIKKYRRILLYCQYDKLFYWYPLLIYFSPLNLQSEININNGFNLVVFKIFLINKKLLYFHIKSFCKLIKK